MDVNTLKQSLRNISSGDWGTLKDLLVEIVDTCAPTSAAKEPPTGDGQNG